MKLTSDGTNWSNGNNLIKIYHESYSNYHRANDYNYIYVESIPENKLVLHREEGPALQYRDGYDAYFWHGEHIF